MKVKFSIKHIACSCLFLSGSLLASVQEQLEPVTSFINFFKTDIKSQSGLSIAVVKDGKVVYRQNFGYSDINGNRPVKSDTAFYIASATKPFFALTTLVAEQNGDLKDSSNLKSLFPNLNLEHIQPDKVTVKHLLAHTSGIDNDPLITATAYTGHHDLAFREFLVTQSKPHPEKKVGDYQYTNVGYNVLSVWFDNFYKQEWQNTMAKTVFAPMNLEQTSAYMTDARRFGYDVALPYSYFGVSPNEPVYLSKIDNTMHSAGGMIASSNDIAKFLIVQTNEGRLNGKQVFSPELIKKSHQVIAEFEEKKRKFPEHAYAWGWSVGNYLDEIIYHHGGAYVGYRTHMSFMPEKKIGVVVLSNEDHLSSRLNDTIADLIYRALLNDKDLDKTIKESETSLTGFVTKMKDLVKKDRENRASRVMELSLEKSSYLGKYSAPLVGELNIHQTVSGEFQFVVGNMQAIATAHKTIDSMRLELQPGRGRKASFDIKDGKVKGVTIMGEYFTKL